MEKLGLRYIRVISDGDSKTIHRLNQEKPYAYGPGVDIIKYECVGHVQKFLGKKLRHSKKKAYMEGGKVLKLKWSGKDGLTDAINIDKLQVYCGGTIHYHPVDVTGMFNAIWVMFHHYLYGQLLGRQFTRNVLACCAPARLPPQPQTTSIENRHT